MWPNTNHFRNQPNSTGRFKIFCAQSKLKSWSSIVIDQNTILRYFSMITCLWKWVCIGPWMNKSLGNNIQSAFIFGVLFKMFGNFDHFLGINWNLVEFFFDEFAFTVRKCGWNIGKHVQMLAFTGQFENFARSTQIHQTKLFQCVIKSVEQINYILNELH